MIKNKKICFVAAHYDDLEIGCGGSIAKLNKSNDITIIIVCDSEFKNFNNEIIRKKDMAKKEGLNGLKILGIGSKKIIPLNIKTFQINQNENLVSKNLLKINSKKKFDIVFTHWENDVHPDHKNLNQICKSVFKNTKGFIEFSSNFYHENLRCLFM